MCTACLAAYIFNQSRELNGNRGYSCVTDRGLGAAGIYHASQSPM